MAAFHDALQKLRVVRPAAREGGAVVGLESLRDAYALAIDAEFDVGIGQWGDANPISFSLYNSRSEAFKQIVRDLIREIQSTEPSSESPS